MMRAHEVPRPCHASETAKHLPHQVNDVTAADLNRDGRLDLLIAAGRPNCDSGFGKGFVGGNGTFGAPIE
jgi:hypothetical protein